MSVVAIVLALGLLACPSVGLAQKRPFTIEDLYRVRSVSGLTLAPDGTSLVYAVTVSDFPRAKRETHLWMSGADGSDLRQVTFGEGGESSPSFSPDGRWIAFVSSRDGSSQVYLLPTGGGEARKLTSVSTGVSNPVWAPDAKSIVFASDVYPECGADDACNKGIAERWSGGRLKAHLADTLLYRHWTEWKDGKRTHALLVDVETGRVRDLTPGDFDSPTFQLGGPTQYAFSPDGRELVFESKRVSDAASSTNNDLWIVSIADPEAAPRKLTADNPAFDGSPKYSPDGRYLAFRVQRQPGFESDLFRLALHDRTTGTTRVLTETFRNWIDEFRWQTDSRTIVFKAEVEGETPLFRLDIVSGSVTKVHQHKTIDEFVLSGDDKDVLYVSRAVGAPPEVYRATLGEGGTPRPITRLNQSLGDEVDIRPAEVLWVTASNGARIQTFVVKPHGFDPSKKYPLVLNVHGGPQQMWADAFRGDWQVYPGAGYVVAFANPHGSPGYGQDFTAQISGDWGGQVYDDLMRVTDTLEQLPYVDKNRMGAMGWSYGGYMMAWFQGNTTRFKALASMMGLYDLRASYGETEELWFPEWEFKGSPWTSPLYEKWSPSGRASHFRTPMLVITGERDYRVSYTQSLQLFTALQKQGVPSRLLVYANAGHWPDWYEMALYYTAHLEWFQKYLGGGGPSWTTEQFLRNAVFDQETGERRR